MNVFDVDDNNHITGLITKIRNLYKGFLSLSVAERGAGTSFLDFIKYSIRSKASTDGLTISMKAATFAAKALNLALSMAVGALVGMAINGVISAIADYAQRIDTAATKTKEEADAANNATSSLKDLVDAYEELGDKSGWSTEDFDQAKDIQEELLTLAKEQGTLDENKVNQLDLQNGKYEEQLGLLKDITEEQLKASESKLIQSKDAQGNKLVKTAKDNNRSHFFSSISANANLGIMNELKDAGIDVFNKSGNFGVKDLNDPDSIAKYYFELGKALDYIVQNTTEAQRAAGGAYHTVYQYLMNEQAALQDDVDAYNDSTDAVNENVNARRKLQAIDFWSDGKSNGMDVSYSFDKVNSAIETLRNTIDDLDASKLNDLLWGTNEGITDEQAQALAALRKALTDMDFSADTDGVNAFIQALVQVGLVAGSTAGSIDAVTQASQKMEDISSQIDEIQTAYKNATTAIEEYNKYGYLSADTLQTLLNEDFEYLSCLELVDGQLQVNTEKYQGMIAAQYQSAAMALVEKANAELAKIAQGEKKDAVEDATKATEDQAIALTERVCPALGEFAKASMTAAAAQAFLANGDAAWSVDPERTKEVYAGLASGLEILDTTVNQIMGNSDKFRQHMNGFDKETKKRNKNTSKSVTDVASAFDTLNKAMKEYNQYGYLCADTAKALIDLDDKFTACLTKQGDKLQINVEQFRKFVKEQLKEANAAKDGGKSADEMNKILNYLDQNVDTTTISFEQLTDAIKGYGTAMDEAKEKTDAIKSAFSSLSEVSKNKIDSPFGALDSDDVEKQYQAIRDLYDNTDLFTDERFAGALNPETGLVDYNSDAFKQMFLEKLDGMATACEETGGKAGKYLAQGFRDAEDKIKNNVISIEEYINGIGSTLENINNRMDNFQSAFNDLSDIVDEYNTYGGLSQDSIQKLMGLDVKYTACLELQGDKLVFNKEAFRALYVAQLQKLAADYEGTDIGKRYAEILQKVADGTWDVTDHMKGMGTEAQNLQTIFSNLKDLFSSLLDLIEDANSKKDNSLKIWGEAMSEDIDKRIDALNKQKEALEEANDEEERAITLAKLKAELEKARTQRTVRKYTGNGYEWVADESAVKEAQDNLNDQQREWRKEDAEKAIDDQIDALNDLKDKYSEAMGLIGESWDDYNKKLQYAAQIQGMTFKEMEGQLDGYKNSVVNSLKAASPVSSIKSTISSIENLISTLEKLNNVYTYIKTGGQSTDGGGLTGLIKNIRNLFGKKGQPGSGEITGSFEVTTDFAQKLFGKGGKLSSIFENGIKSITDKLPNLLGSSESGTGIVGAFSNAWTAISNGAKGLFSNVAGSSGILSKIGAGFASVGTKIGAALGIGSSLGVPAMTAANSAGVTGVAGLVAAGGTTAAAAGTGTLATVASALPVVGAVLAALGIGVNHNIQGIKIQKDIWSNQEDSTAKKVAKSVGYTLLHFTPFGLIATGVKTISGFVKKIFGIQDKNNQSGTSSSGSRTETIYVDDEKVTRTVSEPAKKKSIWDSKFWFWNWGKKATGDKGVAHAGAYNVDEQGPELIVCKPQSGRYTYLETGDGVVPADITSRLFEMGGNPDRWFQDQMAKNMKITESVGTNHGTTPSISIGDIYVQKPIGDVDTLAREINLKLPTAVIQGQSKR